MDMRVLEAEAKVVELALAEPFSISTTTWESATNVFVSVRYGDLVGIGEASPDDRAGESPERVVARRAALSISLSTTSLRRWPGSPFRSYSGFERVAFR